MTRRKRTGSGGKLTEERARLTAGEFGAGGVATGTGGFTTTPRQALPTCAATALTWLSQRDDGWLRFTRKRDTDTMFLKWKFTDGRRHNTYIMSVCENWQLDYGMVVLCAKLNKYDMGANDDLAVDSYYQVVEEARGNA